jgi:hypothetical protein
MLKIGKIYKLSNKSIERLKDYRKEWPNFKPKLLLRDEVGAYRSNQQEFLDENTVIVILDYKRNDYNGKPFKDKDFFIFKILTENGLVGWTKADIKDWNEI